MKNGTSQAVLVRDLFSGDGPFATAAEDFLARRCSNCGEYAEQDVRFLDDGHYCPACWTIGFNA